MFIVGFDSVRTQSSEWQPTRDTSCRQLDPPTPSGLYFTHRIVSRVIRLKMYPDPRRVKLSARPLKSSTIDCMDSGWPSVTMMLGL